MKAVLISIKPKYCELIASGHKKVEIRKTQPKLNTPFKCYIYQTKHKWVYSIFRSVGFKTLPNKLENALGKIIGEFVCDGICSYGEDTPYGKYYMSESELADCCISSFELEKYADGKDVYGWHISDFKIYDKPKELSEFHKPCFNYHFCEYCVYDHKKCKYDIPINRPPQSWCYVENKGETVYG